MILPSTLRHCPRSYDSMTIDKKNDRRTRFLHYFEIFISIKIDLFEVYHRLNCSNTEGSIQRHIGHPALFAIVGHGETDGMKRGITGHKS